MRKAAAALLLAAAACAQPPRPGPQVLNFLSTVDDTRQPYALYLPHDFDAAKRYPLLVTLHGAGSDHLLNLRQVFGRGFRVRRSDTSAYFGALPNVEFIVAAPFARGSMGFQGIGEQDVYDMLADVERRFPIDADRVYLTGVDMGGGGTFWLGLTRPDRWAALAPACAGVPPAAAELTPNALDLPVKMFLGEQDPTVPAASLRRWYRNLLELGVRAEYVEYPGVRHDCWDFAYRNGAIFDWLAQYRRNPWPERVRFVTRAYRYAAAYWVQLDGLTPGNLAAIDARFSGRNRLQVSTSGLEGFTLKLAGHPQSAPGAPLLITLDGETLRRSSAAEISFERRGGRWRAGRFVPPPEGKRPGAEGPIAAAIEARHVYVYGTADRPAPDELRRRREMALAAAQWSTSAERLVVSFPVKADAEVTPRDLAESNLVLFGNRDSNSLIARFTARFPMSLNPGAADYGLLFIAPLDNGRYALVDSGLAWWTGADRAQAPGRRLLGAPYQVLSAFPDYVFFKGSLSDIVGEGRFDQHWKLPAEAAARLRETGAITVH